MKIGFFPQNLFACSLTQRAGAKNSFNLHTKLACKVDIIASKQANMITSKQANIITSKHEKSHQI